MSDELFDSEPDSPMPVIDNWLAAGHADAQIPNPNAILLATVRQTARGPEPNARVVLAKSVVADPGYLVFFTNYDSQKARELEQTRRASAVFLWDHQQRQVRIWGPVTRSPGSESDAYFQSRPLISRIGAWASRQSRPIESRDALVAQAMATAKQFSMSWPPENEDGAVPRPGFWGGYRLWAESVELWRGQGGRLHDRLYYTRDLERDGDAYRPATGWHHERLQP